MDEKLERILEEMQVTNDEFEKILQENYQSISENKHCNENSENIKYLQELTGIKPKKKILQQHTINVIKCGTESNTYSLNKTKTKVKLTNNKIQAEYKKSFEENKIYEVDKLYQETKILPDFKELGIDIQDLYNRTFSNDNGLYWTKCLMTLADKKPEIDEELKKEKLWEKIRGGYIEDVEELIDFFGYIPKIDRRLIQTFYAKELNEEFNSDFYNFYKILKIPVEQKVAQNALNNMIKKNNYKRIQDIINQTGYKPDFEIFNNKAIEKYKKNDISGLKHFSSSCGLEANIPEELVHEKYKYGFERGLNYLIEENFNYFNIKPKYHDIQMGYKTFIRKEEYKGVTKLENLFGVKPSKNVYKLLIKKIMTK